MGGSPDVPQVQTYRAKSNFEAAELAKKRGLKGPSTRGTRSGLDDEEEGLGLSRGTTLLAQGTQDISRGKMGA